MRKWIGLAFSVALIACSGGRDPSTTVSGGNEYAGPGAPGFVDNPGGGLGGTTTSLSTLAALCIKACAHTHAKDCESQPAHAADDCEPTCISETKFTPPMCADEAAAVYACTVGATITCSNDLDETPIIVGCDDQSAALDQCLAPGSNCIASGLKEDICLSLGLPTFVVCSDGLEPPGPCTQVSSTSFCCK